MWSKTTGTPLMLSIQNLNVAVTAAMIKCTLEHVMSAGYRIVPTADKFTVFGPYNEDVAVHSTREEAEEEVKRCLEEDARSEMAKVLVDSAIKSYMDMFRVDRETAREEISHAAQVVD
jgi:hypothetical protein